VECCNSQISFRSQERPWQGSANDLSFDGDRKSSIIKNTAKHFSIAIITMNSFMSYSLVLFLADSIFACFNSSRFMDIPAVFHSTGIGIMLATFCTAEFLHQLTGCKRGVFWLLAAVLIISTWLNFFIHMDGFRGGITFTLCCLCFFGTSKLAKVTREALPITFRLNKAIYSLATASLPGASFVNFALFCIWMKISPQMPSYISKEAFLALALFVTLGTPAFAIARCSRTSKIIPLVTLAGLQFTSQFLGFTVASFWLTASMPEGLVLATPILGAASIACLLIAACAAMGAILNGWQHKYLMNKGNNLVMGFISAE
jgi:hypothetical protein